MDRPINNKPVTFEVIEKYFSGKMTREEMHALEKAALDDPFLAEALEGYDQHKNNWAEVNKQAGLLKDFTVSNTSSTKLPVWKLYPVFIRVAAIIIIILLAGGIGWYSWFRQKPDSPVIAEIVNPKNQNNPTLQAQDTTLNSPELNTQNVDKTKTNPSSKTGISKKEEAPKINKNAPLIAMQEKIYPDSTVNENKPDLSKAATSAKVNTFNENLALQPPAPIGGMAAFLQYVNERAGFYKKLLPENYQSGVVKIDFHISSNGQPENLKIIQSLSPTMDSLAGKILSEGPAWQTRLNDSISSIKIRF